MRALGFHAETCVALFFDGLEGVTGHAALLFEGVELLLEAGTLLLPLADLVFGLLAGRLEISESILQGSSELLLGKEVFLNRADARLLILNKLRMRNVLALVAGCWR